MIDQYSYSEDVLETIGAFAIILMIAVVVTLFIIYGVQRIRLELLRRNVLKQANRSLEGTSWKIKSCEVVTVKQEEPMEDITEENYYEILNKAKAEPNDDIRDQMFKQLRAAVLRFPPSIENDRRQDKLSFAMAKPIQIQRSSS